MNSYTFLPKKLYLSGSDYFQILLERDVKRTQCGNNLLQLAITVENDEIPRIQQAIKNSPLIYWAFNTRLKTNRFFNLPHWEFREEQNSIEIITLESNLEDHLNNETLQFDLKTTPPVRIFQLIESSQTTFLICIHHALCDGRGLGILSKHLSENKKLSQDEVMQFFQSKNKTKKFSISLLNNIWTVRNFVKAKIKGQLAQNCISKETKQLKIKLIDFSLEETQQIDNQAKNHGARFGSNFYQMASCVKTYQNKLLQKEGVIWFPVPFDGRKKGGIQPMFNNFINFTFFRIEQESSMMEIVASLKKQFNEQLDEKIPMKYNDFLNSMLRIPERTYYWMIKSATGKNHANILYSNTGKGSRDLNTTFEGKIKNIKIIPPFTFPPGISFVFSRYNEKMQVSFIYSDALGDKKIASIERNLKENLLYGDQKI